MRALLPLLLAGCAGSSPEDSAPVATPIPFCEGELAYRYDPETALQTFPDDHWTVPDAGTTTGLRVSMPKDHPAFDEFPDIYDNLLDQLGTLDGFGLTPALTMTFSDPVPALDVTLLVEDGGVWGARDVTVTTFDSGRAISVVPWRPLPPASRAVLAVRTDPTDPGCVSPAPTLRALLEPASDAPLAARYAEGLAALGWAPEEVGAMVVFTTQDALGVDAAVAADVATRSFALDAPFTCADEGGWRDCRGALTVGDYRDADGIVPEGAPEPRSTYALPMAVWLPPAGMPGPYPVVLCGHGLGGSKSQCQFMAELGASSGIATVAIDAQQHGDHPLRAPGDDLDQIMALFGFSISPQRLDPLVMRDNFRASAWDKLQVVRAVEGGLDIDGDTVVDLDPTRIEYAGASLGGIMGPELMAWSPNVAGGVLVVPGGGLMNLVLDSETFGIVASMMTPAGWDEDDLTRAIPMVQTLIDAGDPLVHAAAITARRATDEQLDVAVLMALDDTIVPNSATAALAQAFGVDGVGEELLPVDGVTFGAGPARGNLPDGATGALVELDVTQPGADAPWEPADHSTLHESEQAAAILMPFVTAVFAAEVPAVADPYAPGAR